ncbi:MAG: HlyD family efflux transporter periplasmic adaptor subunit [Bacteroidales bacterium]|nr:HlyD family efflux transporter periplasmic adaptor subunit [Bacteroidales bacterium]
MNWPKKNWNNRNTNRKPPKNNCKGKVDKANRGYQKELRYLEYSEKQREIKMADESRAYREKLKNLEVLKQTLEKLTIHAPSAGMVIYHNNGMERIKQGSEIQVFGDPTIANLPDFGQMSSRAYVNETEITKLKLGQKVEVTVDAAPGTIFNGVVTYVSNVGLQRQLQQIVNYEILISVPNKNEILKPSMTSTNKIFTSHHSNAIVIPYEAIRGQEGNYYVIRLRHKKYEKQKVTIQEFATDNIIVTKGLKEGDKILLSSAENVLELPLAN